MVERKSREEEEPYKVHLVIFQNRNLTVRKIHEKLHHTNYKGPENSTKNSPKKDLYFFES